MTDHEPFQREPQNPQDPQVVVFSPELLKLADRRRQALEDCRQAAEDGDANAVVQMGMNCLYGIGGAAKDPEKAFRWFSQTAPDDPAGLYWLGECANSCKIITAYVTQSISALLNIMQNTNKAIVSTLTLK